ncbi:hypothetical protein SmJEL517_g03483 [Synchytrium microbalum]|uniref:Coiled-coil domain-containing protein n=1 Tax=Synchytrium microbalum TaxID=1806994 RepID=A0A507C6Q1_9FUNG|nr:uncharacterized protein SmJEL517_g03483 [Synchytrium microbalum]TPX33734.1 hypothetical protein SmJEL517_g03483 [Synchytrium microbalum]
MNGLDDDDVRSTTSEVSLLEQLSRSERITGGRVQLDWSTLPPDIGPILPDSVNNRTNRSFVNTASNTRPATNTRLPPRPQQAESQPPPKPTVLPSPPIDPPSNTPKEQEKDKKIYNFHQCHFEIVRKRDLLGDDSTNEGLGNSMQSTGAGASRGMSLERGTSEDAREDQQDLDDLLGRLNRIRNEEPVISVESGGGEVLPQDPDMTMDDLSIPSQPNGFGDSMMSTKSKTRGMDSFARHEPSFRASIRSSTRSSFLNVETASHLHAELSDLSAQLKEKSDMLHQRARDLDARELKLKEASQRMNDDVVKRVGVEVEKREQAWKKDAETIILKYDEALQDFAKESKRMSSSVRELVTVNRSLRAQLKDSTLDTESQSTVIQDLTSQLKQARDRNERLKASLQSASLVKPLVVEVKERNRENDKLDELKRIVLAGHKRSTYTACTQTVENMGSGSVFGGEERGQVRKGDVELNTSKDILIDYLCEIHRCSLRDFGSNVQQTQDQDESFISARNFVADDVIDAMRRKSRDTILILSGQILSSIMTIVKQNERCLSSYLMEFILSFVRHGNLTMQQKHSLSDVIFTVYTKHEITYDTDDTTIALMQMVLLSTVGQYNVIEVVLDDVVSRLVDGHFKHVFLENDGVEYVHPLLRRSDGPSVPLLASGVLLNLCADGDWLPDFLTQCSRPVVVNSCAAALGQCVDSINGHGDKMAPVAENVSVLLQKLSKIPNNHILFRSNTTLMDRLSCILDEENSGGGNGRRQFSEFLILNVRSIVRNLA